MFCILADKEKSLPALSHGKRYADFQLDDDEWEIISLAHQALAVRSSSSSPTALLITSQIPANAHSELSAEKIPTCQRVYPVIERLQFQWEELITNPKFDPVLPALEVGLKNMSKWYRATDRTSIYFVCHGEYPLLSHLRALSLGLCFYLLLVLDPGRKLTYLSIVWEDEWIKRSMARMSEIVSCSSMSHIWRALNNPIYLTVFKVQGEDHNTSKM